MNNVIIKDKDAITMKLLHFFITEEGYTPIIVHGVQEEIWLENLKAPYSIIRIMSGHIHNREQLEFDLYKTQSLISRIKKKTFRFRLKALSIFFDVEENVELDGEKGIDCINVSSEDNLKNNDQIKEAFPSIMSKLKQGNDGLELFVKITEEINEKTEREGKRNEDVFKMKKPYVTIGLIAINVFVYLLTLLYGLDAVATYGALYGPAVREGEVYRLLTAAFIHSGLLHLFLNMYALYIIGIQLESFYGSLKYLIIYLFSAIMGSLLSMTFLGNAWSLGASGAIFGLFGALLYFGYHYRVYLGNTLRSQIIPVILLNLFIGLAIPSIDMSAHIGGLFGGIIMSMAVGLKYQTTKMERINGIIISILAAIFLIYIAFVYSVNI
jgi:rhomboid protease GluP